MKQTDMQNTYTSFSLNGSKIKRPAHIKHLGSHQVAVKRQSVKNEQAQRLKKAKITIRPPQPVPSLARDESLKGLHLSPPPLASLRISQGVNSSIESQEFDISDNKRDLPESILSS
jgi:hypothetical protein